MQQRIQYFAQRRAVLISGGIDSYNNWPRYLNDLKAFYSCLINNPHRFAPADIQVLYANGGVYDMAGQQVLTNHASKANFQKALHMAICGGAAPLGPDDLLVVMTTNHGAPTSPHWLNLWGSGEHLDSFELGHELRAQYSSPADYYFLGVFGECFGSAMESQVEQNIRRGKAVSVAASSTFSYKLPPDDAYDAFLYHFTAALVTRTPSGYPAFSDINNDSHISIQEAFDFACRLDMTGDLPVLGDGKTGIAARMTLNGILP